MADIVKMEMVNANRHIVIELLLRHGAAVKPFAGHLTGPAIELFQHGAILDLGRAAVAFISALDEGHKDLVKLLLNIGISPDVTTFSLWESQSGRSVAAEQGNLEIMEIALDAGTTQGAEALCMASHLGKSDTVNVLLDYGVDVNATSKRGIHRGESAFSCIINFPPFEKLKMVENTTLPWPKSA